MARSPGRSARIIFGHGCTGTLLVVLILLNRLTGKWGTF